MQKKWLQPLLPHLIALVLFLLIAIIYCKPAFEHKVLKQADVTEWQAMAQNSYHYKFDEKHGVFPLWTQGMFSGMPAYQISMDAGVLSPQYILYWMLTLGLPKLPAFFFLACICFYFLSQVLKINPWIGIIGALAYAYATYNPTALVAGHDTKMTAIAWLPAFIASLMLIYEKKWLWGLTLTSLIGAAFIAANHPQIVYYGLMIAGFMTAAYVIRWIREKQYRILLKACVFAGAAGLICAGCNAIVTLTTYDYAAASNRGGSQLATPGSQVTKNGLSLEYAFRYSMYKTEPFELLVPKIFGGGGNPADLSEDSKTVAVLEDMPPQLAQQLQPILYWGGIDDDTGGPAYAGAIICLLAFIGFFTLDGKHKWWILALSLLSIVMSWGIYFSDFNGFLLHHLPGYNKFRAPSVIMVIPNFLLCVMAILCLQQLLTAPDWKKFKKGLLFTGGVFAVLLILYYSYDYTTGNDRQLARSVASAQPRVQEVVRRFQTALKQDRQALFLNSITRSFLFIAAAAVLAALAIKRRLKPLPAIVLIGALSFVDLLTMDWQYLNYDRYQDEAEASNAFTPTPSDQLVLRDSSWFRVFDIRSGLVTLTYGAAPTSYFHRSIGGYHPAKLSIYNDLIENQLARYPNCMPVLDMLNTKYIFQRTESGQDTVTVNPGALGPAWFVQNVRYAPTPKAVMDALTGLDTKDTAIAFTTDQEKIHYDAPAAGDTIVLQKGDNDEMRYQSQTSAKRFAVFSEVFYDRGWKAYIDDTETPIIRTNYVLRGLIIPAGKHTIRFVFKPASYYTGKTLQGIASLLLLAMLIGSVFLSWKRKN